jgi:Icc-related predicted phosphoesterase
MRIQLYSDIHSDLAALRHILSTEADVWFSAGDLVNWARGLDAAGVLLAPKGDRAWVIPGNHESADQIETFCSEHGLRAMHSRSIEVNGVHIAALGHSNPTPFDTPGEYTEEELARRLTPFADLKPLVLVCHCPPKNTPLDRAGEGLHFGSTAVREFIDSVQPDWFFCGHIHEAAGVETTLGRTRAINLGKRGYLLEL